MLTKSKARIFAMSAFFAAVFAIFTAGSAYAQSCSQITDQQIVDAIYAKFQNNGKISPHLNHLNVTVVREPVSGAMQAWKTVGWVSSAEDVDLVRSLMLQVFYDLGACWKLSGMNVQGLKAEADYPPDLRSSGGCGEMQQCGDICIPKGESCNIKGR